jgi:hypothetical protein
MRQKYLIVVGSASPSWWIKARLSARMRRSVVFSDGGDTLRSRLRWSLRSLRVCRCSAVISNRLLTPTVQKDLQQKRMRFRRFFAYLSIVAYLVTVNARETKLFISGLSSQYRMSSLPVARNVATRLEHARATLHTLGPISLNAGISLSPSI